MGPIVCLHLPARTKIVSKDNTKSQSMQMAESHQDSSESAESAEAPPVVAPYDDALHKLWLQHTSDLYDFCNTHTLRWPACSVAFLRCVEYKDVVAPKDYSVVEIAMGCTSYEKDEVGMNTRMVAMPFADDDDDEFEIELEAEAPCYSKAIGINCPITSSLALDCPPTCIKPMPRSAGSVAVIVTGGRPRVICREGASPNGDEGEEGLISGGGGVSATWQQRFVSPSTNCTAAAWNPHERSTYATTAADGSFGCYHFSMSGGVDETFHKSCFEDECVAISPSWHGSNASLVAVGGGDGRATLVDTRTRVTSWKKQLHRAPLTAVELHPNADFLFATSAGNSLRLWDMRKLNRPTAELIGHTDLIAGIEWAPFCRTALLSYGLDHTVLLWDLEHLGAEKDSGSKDRHANPELVFMHHGHTAPVRQAAWCPFHPARHEWTVASVCDNNALQIWSPAKEALDDYVEEDV